MRNEHSVIASGVEWTPICSSNKHLVRYLVDILIICSASGALTPLLGFGQWSKPLLFILSSAYVGYRLATDTGSLISIYQILRRDLLFWSIPLVVICWSFISTLWSPLPLYSLASATALSVTALMGLYFGSKYTPMHLITLLAVSLTVTMLASLVACLLFPETGIMHYPQYDPLHDGRWRGVYTHKNWLGLMAGITAIMLGGIYLKYTPGRTCLSIAIIAAMILAALLLYKAESTSALIALSGCAAYLGYRLYHGIFPRNRSSGIVVAILLLPIVLTAFSELHYRTSITESTTHGFTRTSSFSGRVPHWQHILQAAEQKPLTGFGYSAFWGSDYAKPIDDKNQWVAFQAHSGWLEAILDFGIPVALLAITWMVLGAARHLQYGHSNSTDESTIVFTLMLFMLIVNTSESLLFNSSGLLTVIYIALCVRNAVRIQSEESLQ